MPRSRLLTDEFDARTDRRSVHLYATDAQFRDAAPLDAVTEAIRRPRCWRGTRTVPPSGERAPEPITSSGPGACCDMTGAYAGGAWPVRAGRCGPRSGPWKSSHWASRR